MLLSLVLTLSGCTPAIRLEETSKQPEISEQPEASRQSDISELKETSGQPETSRQTEAEHVPGDLEPETIGTACKGEMPPYPAAFEMLKYTAGDIYIRKESPEDGYEDGYIYYRLVHTDWVKGEDGCYLGKQKYNEDTEMLWEKDPYYFYSQDMTVGEGAEAIQLHIEGLANFIWIGDAKQMIQFRSAADDLGPRNTMLINYTTWMEIPFRTSSGEIRHYWVFWDSDMQCFCPFAEQSHLWEAALEENYTFDVEETENVEETEKTESDRENVNVYFTGDSGRSLRLIGEPSQGIVVPADDPILLPAGSSDQQEGSANRPATVFEDGGYTIDLHGSTFRFRVEFDDDTPVDISADPDASVKAEYALHYYPGSIWLELNASVTEQTVYPSNVSYYLYWNAVTGQFEDRLWETDIWYRSLESPLTIVDIRSEDTDIEGLRLLFRNERHRYYFLDLMTMQEAGQINRNYWGYSRNGSEKPEEPEYAVQPYPSFVTLHEEGIAAVYDVKKVDELSEDGVEVYEPAEDHRRSVVWYGNIYSNDSINRFNALSQLIIGDPGLYRFTVEDMGDPDIRHYTGMVYSPKEGSSKEIIFTDDLTGIHIHEFFLNSENTGTETEWMEYYVDGEKITLPRPPEDSRILQMPGSPHLYSRRSIPTKPGYSEGTGYYVLQDDTWTEVPETELVQTFTIRGTEYEAHMLLTVDDGHLLQVRKQAIFAEGSERETAYLLTYRDSFAFLELRPAYEDLGIDPTRYYYFSWNPETGQFDDIFADSDYWDYAKNESLTLQSVSEDGKVFIFNGMSEKGTNLYRVEWPEMKFIQMEQEPENLGRH